MAGKTQSSHRTRNAVGAIVLAGILVLTAWAQLSPREPEGDWGYEIVASMPHDPMAFTQGLVVHAGRLFESTGHYGASTLREVELDSGSVLRMARLGSAYFGEGITILGDRLYQLTWQNSVAFVYDIESFERVGALRYDGEGWGLTHDGTHLILSDGSATLRYYEPETFDLVRSQRIVEGAMPVSRLNELEYVNGEIWANVWYQDRIARISPETGTVSGWIDLSRLYPRSQRGSEDVLNGIAYDADADRLFVTGKNWPRLYEIEVGPH